MPVLETKGAISAQGFGLTLQQGEVNYIEDVFSTWLYTGNSTTGGSQTITNGIDLSTKGGLLWIKGRNAAANHIWTDSTRGVGTSASDNNVICSNLTTGNDFGGNDSDYVSSFLTNGFSVTQGGTTTASRGTNFNNVTYSSWGFCKQPKFFDVVFYTGDGTTGQTVAHNLGSVPGCIIIKPIATADWRVYHQGSGSDFLTRFALNKTGAATNASGFGYTAPTSTVFSPRYIQDELGNTSNSDGVTYVAYLFAHNAGGFGLSGNDNVISCGSYTGNGSTAGPVVDLGYEPQWVLIKDATNSSPDWWMFDNMRGVATGGVDLGLRANTSGAEVTGNDYLSFIATGFQPTATTNTVNQSGDTYIYIAIRRGPMKVPTTGTSVFNPGVWAGTGSNANISVPFAPDLFISKNLLNTFGTGVQWYDRLRGLPRTISSTNTSSEYVATDSVNALNNRSVSVGSDPDAFVNYSGSSYANWVFQRAPGFFDEVCYTGTAANRTVAHNLQVVPQLMFVKSRDTATNWAVYSSSIANTEFLLLNTTAARATDATYWNSTTPTASVFTVGTDVRVNNASTNYVAYLFASCPGVSSVGSFTGTGATQTINCGFTGGARFVLIKATSTTGDWYVWDSARGIVAGNDPYLRLNSTAAQVTNTDWVDTAATGFELSDSVGNLANTNGVGYIFLAIA